MTEPVRIRVTKDGAKTRYELMHEGVKLRDVTHNEICQMIEQFSRALIFAENARQS